MFRKHTEIITPTGSLHLRIVHATRDKVAYYDLNKSVVKRKPRADKPLQKRRSRLQSKPLTMDAQKLADMLSHYQYEIRGIEYDNGLYVPRSKSPNEQLEIKLKRRDNARFNYDLIKPIVEDSEKTYEYLYTDRGTELIKEISAESGVNAAQISRLLTQYFYRGSCFNAMYPDYRKCGSNFVLPLVPTEGMSKRGRKSSDTYFRGRTKLDEDNILKHLERLGKKKFMRMPHTKQYEVYDFYFQSKKEKYIDEDGKEIVERKPLEENECISYDQYYTFVRAAEKEGRLKWQQKGDKRYLSEYRSKLKRARSDVPGPAFRYEVDATIEDVYLIYPYNKKERLSSGRPTVYRVMDVDSGMTVGFHVGIGGPNWRGVMQALYNAFTDKVEFCKQFGVDITHKDWPCNLLCTELAIDNGVEYPKKNMMQLLDEKMGIDCINYLQIYAGYTKGTVEGEFQHTKNDIIQFMPGLVERIPEKGDTHASNLAVYDYDKFVHLLIINTILRNNFVPKPRVSSKAMEVEGVRATSRARWNFGLRHYMNNGRGMTMNKEDVMFKLLPRSLAATTAKGIKYRNVYYHCEHAARQGWLNANPKRPVKKLDIRYFDGSTDKIWYKHDGVVYEATLNTEQDDTFEGVTWFDVSHKQSQKTSDLVEQQRELRQARFIQKNNTQRITKEALDALKGLTRPNAKSSQSTVKALKEITKANMDRQTASMISTLMVGESKSKEETVSMETLQSSMMRQMQQMYPSSGQNQ